MTLLHKRSSVDEASIITKAIIEIKVPMKVNGRISTVDFDANT